MEQELTSNSKVLEVGTGLISFAIADKVKSITAIDYSPEMIKLANSKLEDSNFNNIEFKVNSATNIKQKNKSFDVIIASNVFHLLPEAEKALQKVIRLLADNGKVILSTYCHGQNLKTRFISAMMSLTGFKAVNKWSLKQYRKFVEQDGLTIEKIENLIESNYNENVYPHHFHIHNYVINQELTFHIKVDNKMDVLTAHDIATNIENLIKKELYIMTTIHIEPKGFKHDGD